MIAMVESQSLSNNGLQGSINAVPIMYGAMRDDG